MKLFPFIPHRHRWQEITITRADAVAPNGRSYLSTCLSARCKSCNKTIHRIYYRDLSDAEARRWLG